MADIVDILEKAADLIEPEGAWLQGELDNASETLGRPNCFCLVGAIYEVSPDGVLAEAARDAVARALGFERDLETDPADDFALPPVPSWNDAPERTQAEVVAKLREAAAKARAEQVQS